MTAHRRSLLIVVGIVSFATSLCAQGSSSQSATGDDEKKLELPSLPHLSLDVKKRHLDIEATVCLDGGMLELIACTKDSKEHESIVAVKALPKHIHLMLTLLGAKSGHPPRREAIDATQTRWRDVPAKGHPTDVFLVFENEQGETVEKPIQEFLKNKDGEPFYTSTFLFAGSLIRQNEEGRGIYLADFSGHFMTLSSFGDEVLCLPRIHSHANDQLAWEVNSQDLPAVGSDVLLRLKPQKAPETVSSDPRIRRRELPE